MFAGIIEGARTVTGLTKQPGGIDIMIDLKNLSEGVTLGDSVSVDGVCLTVAQINGSSVSFNIMTETLTKTTLGNVTEGSGVNIERSVRAGDRIDGHFVQGHVFGLGTVNRKIDTPQEYKIWFEAGDIGKFLAPVGSIAVNGVSLTISDVDGSRFAVALIPTTLELTNLGQLKEGDTVNLEPDIIARQIVHWLESRESVRV